LPARPQSSAPSTCTASMSNGGFYRPLGRGRYFLVRWPVLQGRRPRRGSRRSQRPLRVGARYKVLHPRLRPVCAVLHQVIAANAIPHPLPHP
jgi:hypothetical protein